MVDIPAAKMPETSDTLVDIRRRGESGFRRWMQFIDAVSRRVVRLQDKSADLTDIAALTPANDDVLQRKAGHWANRTMAQLAADLAAAFATLSVAGPVQVGSSAVADVPSATPEGQILYISDEAGGAVLAFSDGTDWRRVTDRAIIS